MLHILVFNQTLSYCFTLTYSVISPQILKEWFGRSVICSCVKLSYDHAQSMIDAPDKLFSAEELPPCDPQHPIDEIHQAVLNLHAIAKRLRAQRFEGGALRLDQVSMSGLEVQTLNAKNWTADINWKSHTVSVMCQTIDVFPQTVSEVTVAFLS